MFLTAEVKFVAINLGTHYKRSRVSPRQSPDGVEKKKNLMNISKHQTHIPRTPGS